VSFYIPPSNPVSEKTRRTLTYGRSSSRISPLRASPLRSHPSHGARKGYYYRRRGNHVDRCMGRYTSASTNSWFDVSTCRTRRITRSPPSLAPAAPSASKGRFMRRSIPPRLLVEEIPRTLDCNECGLCKRYRRSEFVRLQSCVCSPHQDRGSDAPLTRVQTEVFSSPAGWSRRDRAIRLYGGVETLVKSRRLGAARWREATEGCSGNDR
jgi:hypothetical protein